MTDLLKQDYFEILHSQFHDDIIQKILKYYRDVKNLPKPYLVVKGKTGDSSAGVDLVGSSEKDVFVIYDIDGHNVLNDNKYERNDDETLIVPSTYERDSLPSNYHIGIHDINGGIDLGIKVMSKAEFDSAIGAGALSSTTGSKFMIDFSKFHELVNVMNDFIKDQKKKNK